ncbi:cytochrome ubiquinol oxidase subunit I [Streptomyces lydicus]|uniref:cytochrome ubiquinol oxidase subunit I n=1 Tax=Streptomyces lydicus TaxID=47763 RepID=UPI0037942626
MSAVDLARLQFAATTGIHWLFVILTMGLVPLVAIMHTRAVFTRDPARRAVRERMTRFWGQLYVINYAVGIVTGLVMEFQFGLSWSGLSKFAGNVFRAPLALETLIAFFAESTFLGMWIFGWGRLRRGVHVTRIWLVALTAYASGFWILIANGFMQHPVGYAVRDGAAYLTDFAALLTNSSALVALAHITLAALTTGGVFLLGISAWHLARGTEETELFRGSLRLGTWVSMLASFFVVVIGQIQMPVIERTQPMKYAVLTDSGVAEVQRRLVAQHGPGDHVPPAGWIHLSMNTMSIIGNTVSTLTLVAVVPLWKDRLVRWRPMAYLMTAMIPFTFVASVGGWVVREVGRQPWLVYGRLTVEDALSPCGPRGEDGPRRTRRRPPGRDPGGGGPRRVRSPGARPRAGPPRLRPDRRAGTPAGPDHVPGLGRRAAAPGRGDGRRHLARAARACRRCAARRAPHRPRGPRAGLLRGPRAAARGRPPPRRSTGLRTPVGRPLRHAAPGHRPARPGPAPHRRAARRGDHRPAGAPPHRWPPVLDGVSLRLPPGHRVVLRGASGSGKSTLLAALLRFVPYEAGSIRVGGRELRDCAAADVRRVITGMTQDAHVFHTTIRANLALARPGATDADLREVARRARLLDWIESLPDGWDTLLGGDGATMSGGQRGRLLLARALLADPPVLVLDEPTEGLDPETAAAVLADILDATRGRTTLLVTHERSGLAAADEGRDARPRPYPPRHTARPVTGAAVRPPAPRL